MATVSSPSIGDFEQTPVADSALRHSVTDAVHRVTAFEAYMLADDSPSHPMTALIEVAYRGSLDRERFEQVLADVLQQHPLLRSTIDGSGRRRRWIELSRPIVPIDWHDEREPLQYPGGREYIDLRREIGIRAWVRTGTDSGRILFQLHHACTDGVGVLGFLLDVLREYAGRVEANAGVAPSRRDASLLEGRDRFFQRPVVDRAKALFGAAKRSGHWRRSRPLSLVSDSPSHEARRSMPPMEAIRSHIFDRDETGDLLEAARRFGVTLNDLLIRDLFVVLADRCAEHSSDQDDCLCVCMPVNLRDPVDAAMPAANKMMMSFLRRTPDECKDADQLLVSVHDETSVIKRTRRGVRLLEVIRLILALRGEIPPRFLAKSSFATAVLSNLGRLEAAAPDFLTDEQGRFECGDITVEKLVTAPNGRPGTPVVLVASTYAARLTIAMRFDPSVVSGSAADEILAEFTERLRGSKVAKSIAASRSGKRLPR